tara:strand:- start:902 stop:1246 length:345 start_codon:yes stop_codon:yes gene_type:complete
MVYIINYKIKQSNDTNNELIMSTFNDTQANIDGYKVYNLYGGYVEDDDETTREYERLAEEAEELYIASIKAEEERRLITVKKNLLIMRIKRHMRMRAAYKNRRASLKLLPIIIE